MILFAAGFLVLEGYGGPGESNTDDDMSPAGKQLSASQGCAADSGINLRFSSASYAGSLSSFSRQVLSHLRNLQANLNHLKVTIHSPNNKGYLHWPISPGIFSSRRLKPNTIIFVGGRRDRPHTRMETKVAGLMLAVTVKHL